MTNRSDVKYSIGRSLFFPMARKQLLIEAALELFAKQGIGATSVQQITDHCGISKGAFYLSFKSKDELILAIIDYFIQQIISDIDQSVRSCQSKDQLLYEFYPAILRAFNAHSGFARLFIKEQSWMMSKEFINKLGDFDNQLNQIILMMLNKLYEDDARSIRYDLLICIKGFIRNYTELSFHYDINLTDNIDALVESLVEKTRILAEHMTMPFLTEAMMPHARTSAHSRDELKEQIIVLIREELRDTQADDLVAESLQLLEELITNQSDPSKAIVIGLLKNLHDNTTGRWLRHMIQHYYQFTP